MKDKFISAKCSVGHDVSQAEMDDKAFELWRCPRVLGIAGRCGASLTIQWERPAITGTARIGHRLLSRWWVRATPPLTVYSNGPLHGWELKVPWWAWPFELVHRLIFGRAKLILQEN